jgi:hypothetical protein
VAALLLGFQLALGESFALTLDFGLRLLHFQQALLKLFAFEAERFLRLFEGRLALAHLLGLLVEMAAALGQFSGEAFELKLAARGGDLLHLEAALFVFQLGLAVVELGHAAGEIVEPLLVLFVRVFLRLFEEVFAAANFLLPQLDDAVALRKQRFAAGEVLGLFRSRGLLGGDGFGDFVETAGELGFEIAEAVAVGDEKLVRAVALLVE